MKNLALKKCLESLKFRDNYAYDIQLIDAIFDEISNFIPASERSEFNEGLVKGLTLLGQTAFADVNPSTQRVNIPYEKFRQCEDGSGVHLELGSYIRFPDDIATQYVKNNNLGDIIRLDMQANFLPDVVASVTALPFADESIDRISSNSLMEHCPYPHEILKEAFRVLRPGGCILTTVPFHFVEHGCPKDYLRFTGQFFEDVCTDIGFSEVYTDTKATSGIFYNTHQTLKAGVMNESAPLGKELAIIHTAVMAVMAGLQGFDNKFHAHGTSLWTSTFSLAVKPGPYERRNEVFDRTLPFYKRFAKYLICPKSGLPVKAFGNLLVSLDGKYRYIVENDIPNMFLLHGFSSGMNVRETSKAAVLRWEASTAG